MIFVRLWVPWLLALPALWMLWEWRRTHRRGAVCLKAAVFGLIILAFAEPRLTVFETKVAVALLADASASIPAEQIEEQGRTIRDVAGARGRNELRVISFADSAWPGEPSAATRRAESGGTNLEAALRNAMGALPPERVPRVVLISDGNENLGAVERAVYQARRLGVPIDTIGLEGRREPELRLAAVTVPAHAYWGESFPIEISVESPSAGPASVELTAEGTSVGRSRVNLAAGRNTLRVRAKLNSAGAALMSGRIVSEPLGELHFERTISLQRPRALLISSDPPESERHLRQVLVAAGFELERSSGALPPVIEPFHLVVVNNQDLEKWPEQQKSRLEEFVREGGGFLLIAGENNLYAELPEETDDPLRKMLPAELAPPRTPEGTTVVLVLDKSSSMEGKKMELARRSAIGVVENLRPIDQVGVLVFDNSFQWAVPLRMNSEPQLIKGLIAGIIADGGTQIAPALHEAYRQIRQSKALYKHILLLTDGISEEGDSIALAREAAEAKVTISTVGLGQDVNRAYLERVAATAEGRSYFLIDVAGLEQLVLRDVMEHTGSSVTERAVETEVLKNVEILDGVALDQAGPLLGWVKFLAKPEAETLLAIRDTAQDPLLVRWQYGLGRSAVFASDAKDRWAVNWVDWEGFDRFWSNLARDLLPRSPATEALARFESSTGELIITYRLPNKAIRESPPPPELYVLGPSEFRKAASLERTATATYEARVPIENRYGLFRIRAASDLDRFPEIAFHRPNRELEEYGSNPALLRKIAAWTGGRVNPRPAEVFDPGGRSVARLMDLWPGFLALAILLNLIELIVRKGWLSGLGRFIGRVSARKRPAPASLMR